MSKYVFIGIAVLVVILLAFYLVPLAFYLVRILIGLAVVAAFALGYWVRGLIEKKS